MEEWLTKKEEEKWQKKIDKNMRVKWQFRGNFHSLNHINQQNEVMISFLVISELVDVFILSMVYLCY